MEKPDFSRYYADTNPRYGAPHEQKYTILYRNSADRWVDLGDGNKRYQFKTRRGANNTARRFNQSPGTYRED